MVSQLEYLSAARLSLSIFTRAQGCGQGCGIPQFPTLTQGHLERHVAGGSLNWSLLIGNLQEGTDGSMTNHSSLLVHSKQFICGRLETNTLFNLGSFLCTPARNTLHSLRRALARGLSQASPTFSGKSKPIKV